jgi:hypothetical protein
MKRLWMLLLPILIGRVEGAFYRSCNCPSSFLPLHFPAELEVQLAATGEACPSAPTCLVHGGGGGCTDYNVVFGHTGACHLTATAVDGRLESADVSVGVLFMDSCCGTEYGPDSNVPVSLTFDQDASTSG